MSPRIPPRVWITPVLILPCILGSVSAEPVRDRPEEDLAITETYNSLSYSELVHSEELLLANSLSGESSSMTSPPSESTSATSPWQSLAPGLDLASFKGDWATPVGDATLMILRVDPKAWELKFACASQSRKGDNLTAGRNLTARRWCEETGAVAATNAGMFMQDYRTHVGYMKSDGHVNSSGVNRYQSVLAFSPSDTTHPPARIFDTDVTPLPDILTRYGSVAQNLRLIKRPGENRWSQQDKMWSEAALGEDASGHILFIFTRSPFTMHELNDILLELPISLVCAQHLEGGPEAQLYVRHGDVEHELVGSYETGIFESDSNRMAWPIPNALCVVRRESR